MFKLVAPVYLAKIAQPTPERDAVLSFAPDIWVRLLARPGRFILLVLGTLLLALLVPPAQSSVGVVLNESLHESMDRITGTGHTAVYFSNICADSPVKLRLCRPGELGSVMSTYINIGEDQPYGWNIVPLNIYLYGVEDPRNLPIFGTYKIKRLLEDRYRDNYLSGYCSTLACQTSLKAEWREMVGATLIRSVYIFTVDTTTEQDRALIAEFNAAVNKDNFNGLTRNCADFARRVINTYFPGAVHRDYLNDFGMTSPKAVARTFTHYALAHPDSNFRVLHFAQVPGTIPRSSEVRAGTEQLYRSKKWLILMAIVAYHELPFAAASYLLTGRFNPQHTFEKYPATEPDPDTDSSEPQLAASPEARIQLVGASADWKDYRHTVDALLKNDPTILQSQDASHFFKHLDRAGTPSIDVDGSLWIDLTENNEPFRVGVSANNVLAVSSSPHLASQFLFARASRVLKSPKHSRETMLEFQQDWDNLRRASTQLIASHPAPSAPASPRPRPRPTLAAGKN